MPIRLICLALVVACIMPGDLMAAPPTEEHRNQVKQAEAALTRAGNFYRARKYAESGEAVREALALLRTLPVDESRGWEALIAPARKQLDRARQLLADQQVRVPAWTPGATATTETVSFARQIAPILVRQCGNCHIQDAQGELSLASFAALKKGSAAGVILMPGDADGSRLIEVLESGDMPRGGSMLAATDIALIKHWINNGATYDADRDTTPLTVLATGEMPRAEQLMVVASAQDDDVLFARDIAPILLQSCLGCHGENNAGANLGLHTFNRLLQGGGNGPPLVVGKPADSLLIQKLRGTAGGARMPLDRDPLATEQIAKIERWIELGGKFDGPDAAMLLDEVIATSAASRMNHAELSSERLLLAEKTWRLILPDVAGNRAETPNVVVVGGPSREVLARVGHVADQQVDKLRKIFGVPPAEPFIRGRLTLFVFNKRYDYGEVGTMLERRELPAAWRGHWVSNPLQPYGCLLLGEQGEASAGLVGQQLAGVYVASLGKVPRWFAEGSARAIVARLDPKDSRIRQWDDQAAQLLTTVEKPAGFLTGELPPEDCDVLSYSFVAKLLMVPPTRYGQMLSALKQGDEFDAAFVKVYGDAPADLVPAWGNRAARRRR